MKNKTRRLSYDRHELKDNCHFLLQKECYSNFRPRVDRAMFKKFIQDLDNLTHFTAADWLQINKDGEPKIENEIFWALKDLRLARIISYDKIDNSYSLLEPFVNWE
jgi:hypothetical protein